MNLQAPALLALALPAALFAADRERDLVILDANAVANLRIETVVAGERVFESTVFALGRIAARPGAVATVSSRFAGRVVALSVHPGDRVEAGQEVLRVESRLPGEPPPVVGLTSPIRGTVTAVSVVRGDPVEPDRVLLEVAELDAVDAVARVPEAAVGRLVPGLVARVRTAAFPGETFVGELVRLGTRLDPATGTLDASFRLPNGDGRLRPGLRVELSIVTGRRPGVLAVPREAVQSSGAARFVFTRDFELPHAFLRTPVVVGETNDSWVEITSGLFPGDEVVTRGAYSLAFAGGGTVSLKEALDAAHGHEHAADGSEMSKDGHGDSHDHAHDGEAGHAHDDHAHPERPWQIATGSLALLVMALVWRLLAVRRRED